MRKLATLLALAAFFVLLALFAAPGRSWAATYACTRSSENFVTQARLVTGQCTPTGTYTGATGDTVGSAATGAASAAVFCGSAHGTLLTLVLGAGSNAAGTAAAVYNFDMTNWKLQAYTAAGSPGTGTALAEGSASLTLTNLTFRFLAICR